MNFQSENDVEHYFFSKAFYLRIKQFNIFIPKCIFIAIMIERSLWLYPWRCDQMFLLCSNLLVTNNIRNILFHLFFSAFCLPLPSNRHHRSNSDCLKGKRENYQVCSVQVQGQSSDVIIHHYVRRRWSSTSHPSTPHFFLLGFRQFTWPGRTEVGGHVPPVATLLILCATIVHSAMHTHMNRPNSSLDWVLSDWAHFTVFFVYVLLHTSVVL